MAPSSLLATAAPTFSCGYVVSGFGLVAEIQRLRVLCRNQRLVQPLIVPSLNGLAWKVQSIESGEGGGLVNIVRSGLRDVGSISADVRDAVDASKAASGAFVIARTPPSATVA